MLGKPAVPARSARTPALIRALSETGLLRVSWDFNKGALCAVDGFRPKRLHLARLIVPHLRAYGTTRFLSSGAFRNGTPTRDNTETEKRPPSNGPEQPARPASRAHAACARRSVGGVAEG